MARVVSSMAAVALALAWSVTSQAGPVNFQQVSADAKWVAHFDADAAKSSPVVKAFCDDCIKDMDAVKKWEEMCKKLHGITLYGTKIAPKQGVLIVHADIDKDALVTIIEKAPDHQTIDFEGHQIHTWTKHKDTKHAHTVAGTIYRPDTLVVACDVDQLKAALNVLEGKSPNLSGKDSPLADKVVEGTILLARAIDLDSAEGTGHFQVLKQLRSLRYAKGQHEGEWFGMIKVTGVSDDVVENLKEVFQGHRALVALHFADQPGVQKLLDKISICVDGKTLRVSFVAPAADVVAQVPAICKVFKEHREMHEMMCRQMMMHKKAMEEKTNANASESQE